MGFFDKQIANIVEWNETKNDVIFFKWSNNELKKGSILTIRPGQNAIFLYNGAIEGVFKESGQYDIESQIIPFLSTLKGFKFGFKSSLRAEVVFINVKEFTVKWGCKNPINIPTPGMRGGMPIRCHGTYRFRIEDYICFIEKMAGIKTQYTVDDVREINASQLDSIIKSWIIREGKDVYNLIAYSKEITTGVKNDLNEELLQLGIMVTSVILEDVSYPDSVQQMITKNAAYNMVEADSNYQTVSMLENMDKNPSQGNNNAMGGMANTMTQMAQMGMGMKMGTQMMDSVQNTYNGSYGNNNNGQNSNQNNKEQVGVFVPNSKYENNTNKDTQEQDVKEGTVMCSKCKEVVNLGARFCPSCGNKIEIQVIVSPSNKFCENCGAKVNGDSKFCQECGKKIN